MTGLAAEVQPEPQSYGKLLEAQIATASKDPRPAIKLATDAIALLDTWIAHYELGRAYLAAGMFAQADSEFDQCLNKRRGEGLSLFVDEEPTFGYFPMAYYYQGRVREGMKLLRRGRVVPRVPQHSREGRRRSTPRRRPTPRGSGEVTPRRRPPSAASFGHGEGQAAALNQS